jgi:thiamine transport system ATP-binding protein
MLEVRDLAVSFEGEPFMHHVNLTVPDGAVVAILGPSGSGKSTLLRTIAGLESPDAGSISWNGELLNGVPPHARGFGLMFQDYALFPHMTVGANVAFGIEGHPQADRRVTEVLEWVGLAGYEHRSVGHLSGGEQQRVALARSLAPEPRVLMLDEPVGSLDRALRERIVPQLRELLVRHQITAIYVTHDQEEAFTISDQMVILRDGTMMQTGTPEQVWSFPANAWVAGFLGFSNIIDVDVSRGVATASWGTFDASALADGRHRVIVRETAIELGGPLSGVATERRFRGGHYQVTIEMRDGSTLEAELDEATRVGDTFAFSIDPEGVVGLPDSPA